MKTLKDVLDEGIKYLVEKEIENGQIDAWYLFSHIYNIDRAKYFLHSNEETSIIKYDTYMDLIKKRAKHIPLQYILGYQEFMGLRFKVNEHVLIPRQDTEILVEEVLRVSSNKDVLDLCTGSGCIIISLMKLGNINRAVGVDISRKALEIAKENASINKVNIEFKQSDLFSRVHDKFDIIVSNPPYIPNWEINRLSPEVRDYEPHLALDGKEDGLYFYRSIAKKVKDYLNPGGYIFFEIGYNQVDDLKKILKDEGIKEVKVIKDLSGLDRVIKGRYNYEKGYLYLSGFRNHSN